MDFAGPGKAQPLPWDGRRIIALRGELHLTQNELARLLNIRPKTLRGWEEGRGYAVAWAVPRLDRLERKLGKSQAMTEARKKSGGLTANPPEVPPLKPQRTHAPTKLSRGALRVARVQKAREIQRLLRRMG